MQQIGRFKEQRLPAHYKYRHQYHHGQRHKRRFCKCKDCVRVAARVLEKLIKARGAKRFMVSRQVSQASRNALDASAVYRP